MPALIQIASLFSGAGAMDLGFKQSGFFSTYAFVESDPVCCETIRVNQRRGLLGIGEISCADVRDSNAVLAGMFRSGARIRGVIAGPPCQSFTPIGKQRGRKDPRGALVFDFARLVCEFPYDFFVMENVPGLVSIERGRVLEDLIQLLADGGYSVAWRVLNAADYGAATTRKRLFVVGFRSPVAFSFPDPTNAELGDGAVPAARPWVTVTEALRGLGSPADRHPGMPQGHVRIKHSDLVVQRFAATVPGKWDTVRKRARLSPERPSPSLVAGNASGMRSHIHPEEPRELTNRESARLQGFPDEFVFSGNRVQVGIQIANAVPIALGSALAGAVAAALKNSQSTRSRPAAAASRR